MTQAQQYTQAIAKLPDRTRHIVAGIVAHRLDVDDDGSWLPLWRMAHEHGKHYEWPTPYELRSIMRAIGLPSRIANEALAVYDSYGPDVRTAIGTR
jgi:hypothetical protein